MDSYIVSFILFTITLIWWNWKPTKKSLIKLGENPEIYKQVKDEVEPNSPKYVCKGPRQLLRMIFLSFLYTRKNSNSTDTIFDKLYEEFASPRSKDPHYTNFFIKIFNQIIVYPKNYDTVKTLLWNDICSDRFPKKLSYYFFSGPGKGIAFNNGEAAKELRRFTMKTLGHLGFGKNQRMSEILYEQLTDLLANFENLNMSTNNKIQVQGLFSLTAINIVWCIIGGDKFSPNDENFLFLHENVEILAKFDVMPMFIALYLPKLLRRFISFLDNFGYETQKFSNAVQDLNKYFLKYIKEKQLRLAATDEPIDFFDYFLLEIEKRRMDDQLNKIYCQEHMSFVLMDLFETGMDTTSKYMECAFMFLTLNPEVQVKVQQEIDSVIGVGVPSFATHKKSMPFTEATIMEIHRLGNIIPSMIRTTTKEWDTDGQHFEKETLIIANFYFFRMDETYWGDPKTFRPQRFLDFENNLIAEKLNHVLPFGAGSRACLGESVATAAIFVFLTGILQRYTLIQSDPEEFLGLSKGFVAVSHPEPFHVSLSPRNA